MSSHFPEIYENTLFFRKILGLPVRNILFLKKNTPKVVAKCNFGYWMGT